MTPFAQTEQFLIWLHHGASGPLTLLPATTQRPWRLLQGDDLVADIPLPPEVDAAVLFAAVRAAAAMHGWEVQACGACAYWQALDAERGGVGTCTWQRVDQPPRPSAQQRVMAAPCAHFAVTADAPQPPIAPASAPAPAVSPSWWNRLRRRGPQALTAVADEREYEIVERSGKRPGTIPCLACPGRMANLGAQKCRTVEGDDRTFSVWRCRQCLGYYLNDYTDKWVRTDALEVVDVYYRLAPREAVTCLEAIERAGRSQITPAELQTWAGSFLDGRAAARSEVRRAR